jgi:hypothetical protein
VGLQRAGLTPSPRDGRKDTRFRKFVDVLERAREPAALIDDRSDEAVVVQVANPS